EVLIPVSALDEQGKPLHAPKERETLNLLAFPRDSFLGRVMYKEGVSALLRQHKVEIVHESVFLAGVKEMVMAGLGMAWLPESLIKRELQAGSLTVLNHGLSKVRLELGLYRSARSPYPDAIARIWNLLAAVSS